MIPERKKTPEEIAALREGLGIPGLSPDTTAPPPSAPSRQPVYLEPDTLNTAPQPITKLIHLDASATSAPLPLSFKKDSHSLRKKEIPLAPAPPVTQKAAIPTHRHDPQDIAQIRKREAIAKLNRPEADPALHLRKQAAHPLLYLPGYLFALSAAAVIYQRFHYITPIALLFCSLSIVMFIAVKKPRSRHHAALIFIVIFLTAVFGGLHYAPLFENAP